MKNFRNNITGENKAQITTSSVTCAQSEIVRLVQRAAGGDVEAFGKLYSTYVEPIYRYVFYLVKNKMRAEDITEDVFIKAWKAIGSCRGKEQTFSSWLYRIAHNYVIDVLRRQRKELSIDIDIERVSEVEYRKPEVETKLEQQVLLDAISYLPQSQRQVIILKFIEGLDNREIGQVMRKSEGAVRILQMRALTTLRQRLGRKKE